MSAVKGHETGQVARERGFYRDPDPRFKDLRGKFEGAARSNGDVNRIKQAAVMHVLAKFALLDEAGDPIVELTRLIKEDDFGYSDGKARGSGPGANGMRDEKPVWGPRSGLGAGSTAERLGWNANETYGGV
jgi:hypothetical protein